jgi:glyoxylase-like metal-dependent hydrolase (beta-lactamase superfamily II)
LRPFNTLGVLALIIALGAVPATPSRAQLDSFCQRLPRAAYEAYEKDARSNDWFEVYEVESGIWAIYEPWQWQEVISYLIIGEDEALLFDTGNGLGDIKAIVDQLTELPVTVLNSHSHFDHIGGNYQFGKILSPATAFSVANSEGVENDVVAMEASNAALCHGLPEGVTAETHHIEPYTITGRVADGDIIDLGNRQLEILQVPGHTDDAIALLDREAGFLWTGDSFYQGPIWLFMPETDLAAYRASIARLAALAPGLKALFPAHNTPKATPDLLVSAREAFDLVVTGEALSHPSFDGTVTFEFDGFGFLMRADYTRIPTD